MEQQDPQDPRRQAEPELTVVVARHEGHTVVHVAGEVDVSSVGRLRRCFHDLVIGGEVHLAIELSEVTFMDSAGLASLVGLFKQVRMFRGSLTLVAPSAPVRRLVEITALDRVFTMQDSMPGRASRPHRSGSDDGASDHPEGGRSARCVSD